MKALCLLFCAVASAVFALPPVRPVLPPIAHGDTETVTNVPFATWQEHVGKFTFSLACRTTPTNNVQAAFGTDADGDGVLSLEESDLVVGWDCGTWFVQSGFEGERIESTAVTGDEQTLVWTAKLSPRTATPVQVTATIGGVAVFRGVDAGLFYNRNWNIPRLTGRGLADSGETLTVRVLPDSLFMIMR